MRNTAIMALWSLVNTQTSQNLAGQFVDRQSPVASNIKVLKICAKLHQHNKAKTSSSIPTRLSCSETESRQISATTPQIAGNAECHTGNELEAALIKIHTLRSYSVTAKLPMLFFNWTSILK